MKRRDTKPLPNEGDRLPRDPQFLGQDAIGNGAQSLDVLALPASGNATDRPAIS